MSCTSESSDIKAPLSGVESTSLQMALSIEQVHDVEAVVFSVRLEDNVIAEETVPLSTQPLGINSPGLEDHPYAK